MKSSEISVALRWDKIVVIMVVKFNCDPKMYVEQHFLYDYVACVVLYFLKFR